MSHLTGRKVLLETGQNGRPGGFVRFAIVDKKVNSVVGTIELFHRIAQDYFNDCGLLRLDLRWDFETTDKVKNILSLVLKDAFNLFQCSVIATKAPLYAIDRIAALKDLGFHLSTESLVSWSGKVMYDGYWTISK